VRLAAELDEARFHHAAAYVAMALEAMDATPEAAVNDNSGCNDVECYFDLDEHNRVWMYLEGDPYIIGRREAARAEMWRFLRVLLPGLE
jgi:hypothetical protein